MEELMGKSYTIFLQKLIFKKMMGAFCIIMILLTGCYKNQDIIGDWLYLKPERELDTFIEECPDEIRFKPDKTYVIVNDCYGLGKSLLVENGVWNMKESQIFLEKRTILTNYSITKSRENTLILEIESISKDTLRLLIEDRVEIYIKSQL